VASEVSCGSPSEAGGDNPLFPAGFASEVNVVLLGEVVGDRVLASVAVASLSARSAGAGSDEFDAMAVGAGAEMPLSVEPGATTTSLATGAAGRSCVLETIGKSTSRCRPIVRTAAKLDAPDIVLVFLAIRPALRGDD
jgi:hypothetical protein